MSLTKIEKLRNALVELGKREHTRACKEWDNLEHESSCICGAEEINKKIDAVLLETLDPPPNLKHEITRFEESSLFNSEHAHSHGYSRAICSCGWKSAPSTNHHALVALFGIHVAMAREST